MQRVSHRNNTSNAAANGILINYCPCLFGLIHLFKPQERINQTVDITKHTVDIEEKGVKLKLTIVDTPGFGDAVNNTEW